MSDATARCHDIELSSIDGANPLGFLAALGAVVTLHKQGAAHARLSWRRGATWAPVVHGIPGNTPEALSELIATGLQGNPVAGEREARRADAQASFDQAKSAVTNVAEKLKGLKGAEREAVLSKELRPLEEQLNETRRRWLESLAAAVPRPELALGKSLDCTSAEYREHATNFIRSSSCAERDSLDFLSAFGSDACLKQKSDQMEPTPFCFITGSGKQYFLDTVRGLMQQVSPERVQRALFQPWAYEDEKLSMRWDPIEDRRYALMDRDPTASGNEARTVWMANLLAYRGLVLFPSAARRSRLTTTGWARLDRQRSFTWPLWEFPAAPDIIRSLLQLSTLVAPKPNFTELAARGVAAAYRVHRLKVGSGTTFKVNFSSARSVFVGPTRGRPTDQATD